MTEAPTERKPRSRRMLGFYIAMGVVALLLVGFCFAWTPLRVWYWEREVRQAPPTYITSGKLSGSLATRTPRTDAARRLAAVGPAAEPAFRRLLRAEDTQFCREVLNAIERPEHWWALPLLVEAAKSKDRQVTRAALTAVESVIAEPSFTTDNWMDNPGPRQVVVDRCRRELLTWWESEGKAKYDRGGE